MRVGRPARRITWPCRSSRSCPGEHRTRTPSTPRSRPPRSPWKRRHAAVRVAVRELPAQLVEDACDGAARSGHGLDGASVVRQTGRQARTHDVAAPTWPGSSRCRCASGRTPGHRRGGMRRTGRGGASGGAPARSSGCVIHTLVRCSGLLHPSTEAMGNSASCWGMARGSSWRVRGDLRGSRSAPWKPWRGPLVLRPHAPGGAALTPEVPSPPRSTASARRPAVGPSPSARPPR